MSRDGDLKGRAPRRHLIRRVFCIFIFIKIICFSVLCCIITGVQASHLSQNKKSLSGFCIYEPRRGLEPRTPSLPWKCSTTELSRPSCAEASEGRPSNAEAMEDRPFCVFVNKLLYLLPNIQKYCF